MPSLGVRLALAFLAVIVVSVGGVALLAHRETAHEFQTYVERGRLLYLERVSNGLANYYRGQGGWAGAESLLHGWARHPSDRLAVADAGGTLVADTGSRRGSAPDAGLGPGTPLEVDGQRVGTLYVTLGGPPFRRGPQAIALEEGEGGRPRARGAVPPAAGADLGPRGMPRGRDPIGPPGPPTPPLSTVAAPSLESGFLERVDRAILLSSVAAAVLAGLLSLLLARQLAHPLRELAVGARRVAAGELTHRVSVGSKDEVGAVAVAFNDMAASLERAEQARRSLVADVAHELRTPLTVIEGTVDAMLDGVYPADGERLASIREEVALLNKLVADLRELSLAEAGQLRLELEPLEPAALVRRVVAAASARAEARHVTLRAEVADELPPVTADASRLAQVFGILLDNALRYTPAGGQVVVGATAQAREPVAGHGPAAGGVLALLRPPAPPGTGRRAPRRGPSGDRRAVLLADDDHAAAVPPAPTGPGVRCWVTDNGPGIGADDLAHVFERFYRADPSRARRSGGSGLGLAIARRYVEAHGGAIWAQSPSALALAGAGSGRGTTIAFWLPAAAPTDDQPPPDAIGGRSRPHAAAAADERVAALRAFARLGRP